MQPVDVRVARVLRSNGAGDLPVRQLVVVSVVAGAAVNHSFAATTTTTTVPLSE